MEIKHKSAAEEDSAYILVHSDRELRRLQDQAEIINPITRRILSAAGIKPGMRVLDVGCGGGDVTFLVSEMVGRAGHVVGVDRAPAAIAAAERRLGDHGIKNVSFRKGDAIALSFDEPFDAVVGRYVLMFQADPAAMLRSVAQHLRPGGIMAFHEPDWDGCRSNPPAPTYDRCCRWIVDAFHRSGIEANMGNKLDSAFRRAGLAAPSMHLESVVGGAKGGPEWGHLMVELIVTMLPEVRSNGGQTAGDVVIGSMEEHIAREIEDGAVIVGRSEVGAWSRLPKA
ncbi:methyltransferase domain-containing protein [Rhizobium sp. BK251]|uniref:class I SAM-dependent methyltransferase n=1 Tax=Rhizobium sp. BK251 TaxID=2512125 RepID=UPI0010EC9158|nr:methyltransferase domain-containing protein [Rhizobium sp. BK251]TCL71224.1 methyltransferase family protein [Rhizobium sp. BK251]